MKIQVKVDVNTGSLCSSSTGVPHGKCSLPNSTSHAHWPGIQTMPPLVPLSSPDGSTAITSDVPLPIPYSTHLRHSHVHIFVDSLHSPSYREDLDRFSAPPPPLQFLYQPALHKYTWTETPMSLALKGLIKIAPTAIHPSNIHILLAHVQLPDGPLWAQSVPPNRVVKHAISTMLSP